MNYSDVYLIPKYSPLRSREEADISVHFLGRDFKAPWIPANMESVIDIKTAKWLSENDYFYIMHRFHDTLHFVKLANEENWKTISISVGVKEEDMLFLGIIAAKNLRVDFLTVDIAHGHSIRMSEMVGYIKRLTFNQAIQPKIIAGNVATRFAVEELSKWGADAVKIGIAGGAACSTKHQTGFHIPMFSCVKGCSQPGRFPVIPLIADGGIRENGDIPKALVAGAHMVMAGSLFASCIDAPGENVYSSGTFHTHELGSYYSPAPKLRAKRYHGSASARQKGHSKHVEGFVTEVPCNGLTYKEKYEELTDSLKSAVSYAGGRDLHAFEIVKFFSTNL